MGRRPHVAVRLLALLFTTTLVAVSAQTTIDVPCAAVANRTFDVAQLAAADGTVLVLQGCAWLNTEVRIVFSRPVVFVFRGVTMVGGIVVSNATTPRDGSQWVVEDSVVSGCIECFVVFDSGAGGGFGLSVRRSVVTAARRAASIEGERLHSVWIWIESSTVVASTALAQTSSSASLCSPNVTDGRITVLRSCVSALSTSHAYAASVVSSSSSVIAAGLSTFIYHSNVSAVSTVDGCASSVGIALYRVTGGATVSTLNVSYVVVNSSITSSGFSAVVSVGLAARAVNYFKVVAVDLIMVVVNSSVTSQSADYVAVSVGCGGFAVNSGNVTVVGASLYVNDSTASSQAGMSVAATCAVGAAAQRPDVHISARLLLIRILRSSVKAQAYWDVGVVAGLCTLTWCSGSSYITASSFTWVVVNSSVDVQGKSSVACLGITSYGQGGSDIVAENGTIYALNSTIAVSASCIDGVCRGIAAAGFVSVGGGSVVITDISISVVESQITKKDGVDVALVGSNKPSTRMRLGACGSRLTSPQGSILSSASSSGQWTVVRSTLSGDSCLNFIPSTNWTSFAYDVDLQCTSNGWSRGLVLPRSCGHNITLIVASGWMLLYVVLTGVKMDTTFPFMSDSTAQCPSYSTVTQAACCELLPPPIVADVPSWLLEAPLPQFNDRSSTRTISGTRSLSPSIGSVTDAPLLSQSNSLTSQKLSPTQNTSLTQNISCSCASRTTHSGSVPSKTHSLAAEGRSHGGAEALLQQIAISDASAKAIVGVSTASTGVLALVGSPSAAASATRAMLVAGAASCRFDDDDVEPSWLQYPLAVGSDGYSKHTVGCLSCLVLLAALAVGSVVIPNWAKWLTILEALGHQYFVPSMSQGAVLVARHTQQPVQAYVCVATLAAELLFCVHRGYVVLVRVPKDVVFSRHKDDDGHRVKAHWSGALVRSYGPYFDSCRDGGSPAVRMVYFVELSCSVMIGCAAGWRPLEGSCVGVAAFMLGVSALLLCYSVWQHPYDGRLDQSFSVSNSLLLALQAGCSVALVVAESASARSVLGYVTLMQFACFFLQPVVAFTWHCALRARRVTAPVGVLMVPLASPVAGTQDDVSGPTNPLGVA